MSTPKRPRTPAQQEASRHNGAQSHGPVTEAGKQRSRMNALKHGLCAASVLLPDEDEAECQELIEQYEQHYRPVTHLELARVREMALCDWRLRRTVEIERGLFSLALQTAAEDDIEHKRLWGGKLPERDEAETLANAFQRTLAQQPALTLLLRYQAQLQRSQERARKALKQLQAERQQQEREQAALPNEPTPALQRNEPKPVTPIRPAATPNEPEPAPSASAAKHPNEPKPTLVSAQEDLTKPQQ